MVKEGLLEHLPWSGIRDAHATRHGGDGQTLLLTDAVYADDDLFAFVAEAGEVVSKARLAGVRRSLPRFFSCTAFGSTLRRVRPKL